MKPFEPFESVSAGSHVTDSAHSPYKHDEDDVDENSGESKANSNEAKQLGLLGRIQRTRHIPRRYFTVYLSRKDDGNY